MALLCLFEVFKNPLFPSGKASGGGVGFWLFVLYILYITHDFVIIFFIMKSKSADGSAAGKKKKLLTYVGAVCFM